MTLHVVNNRSVVGSLSATDLAGDVISWDDVLFEGAVPAGIDDRELRRVRSSVQGKSLRDYSIGALTYLTARDYALAAAEDVLLWFEADLACQLQLTQILAMLARSGRSGRLICIDSYPGYEGFVGLGQLNPDELLTLLGSEHQLTDEELSLGVEAWEAFRSPNPTTIERLLAGDTAALPFLADAFLRHLEEFPSASDGLSRTERTILARVAAGTNRWTHLFNEVLEAEERPFMDDLTFRHRLEAVMTGATPLVRGRSEKFLELMRRLRGSHPPEQASWPAAAADELELTAAGERVLAGDADALELNGIDRWLGGVHLEGRAPQWRWDDRDRRIVSTH
jgi:hypothetical protein